MVVGGREGHPSISDTVWVVVGGREGHPSISATVWVVVGGGEPTLTIGEAKYGNHENIV